MRILFARVEDVLDVYHRDFAADEVLVCMDETSRQHIQETRLPLPARPGERERFDYEYTRAGVSNLFMLSAPLEGWRQVKVTDHHTKVDWAELIKDLVDKHYPDKGVHDGAAPIAGSPHKGGVPGIIQSFNIDTRIKKAFYQLINYHPLH